MNRDDFLDALAEASGPVDAERFRALKGSDKIGDSYVDRMSDLENELDMVEMAFLQSRGWHHTSSTPDSVWMWEKEYNGKTYMVMKNRALSIERNGLWV